MDHAKLPFRDRTDAGRRLGRLLAARGFAAPAVYALPRGGVPVAAEVAAALSAPLDLILARKLGAPGQPELAIGAVAEGSPPELVLDPEAVALTGADPAYLAREEAAALREIARRRARYLAGRDSIDPAGRCAILVDDGLATGATARAALRALRRRGPARLILAVPVGTPEACAALAAEADVVITLVESGIPRGIGGCYLDFHQLEDAEVIEALRQATHRA
ncbi:putative phosphoribosyl transferase [Humitalea rosea]|uniref:Putative phosphoribosyl transferase n=1 Tax=Humitalea rosea TaxID=990373 RepID=A0A2W7HTL1_9PROT|nr:phosphoribosyltransferase family protein [Humitalea rosea]PZW36929.1 putative phosphoribosyl transferase [Humitalea rosea]